MIPGRFYAAGECEGAALVLSEPISLWGGISPETGIIINSSHPQRGLSVAGRILVMRAGRGSSSSSSVLAEAIRRGTAPAAILLGQPDPILTVGAIVAETLYGLQCPIVVAAIEGIATGDWVKIARAETGAALVTRSRQRGGADAQA
jgi:predicted aconitase with swiveling domain